MNRRNDNAKGSAVTATIWRRKTLALIINCRDRILSSKVCVYVRETSKVGVVSVLTEPKKKTITTNACAHARLIIINDFEDKLVESRAKFKLI
jgi:hypothetical protein